MSRPIALRFEHLVPSDEELPADVSPSGSLPTQPSDGVHQSQTRRQVGLVVRAGRFETVTDHRAIQQDLRMLLTTQRGERVMRPEYGCDLHRLLFAPNDETTAGMAIHYVQQAIERWEDRITDVRVDADANGDGRLTISLSYRVRNTRQVDRMHLSVNLEPGEGP